MAEKIVQLQNKEGDDLFPVAGSMKGDSVATAMIKDDAVTNDKIGWTTLYKNRSNEVTWSSIVEDGSAIQIGQMLQITVVSTARSGWAQNDELLTLPASLQPQLGGWYAGVASDGTACQLNLAYGTRKLTYQTGFGSATRRLRTTIMVFLKNELI